MNKDPFHAPECNCPKCMKVFQDMVAREELVEEVIAACDDTSKDSLVRLAKALEALRSWKP